MPTAGSFQSKKDVLQRPLFRQGNRSSERVLTCSSAHSSCATELAHEGRCPDVQPSGGLPTTPGTVSSFAHHIGTTSALS